VGGGGKALGRGGYGKKGKESQGRAKEAPTRGTGEEKDNRAVRKCCFQSV